MHKFFKKDNYAPLHEIGETPPSIFFECCTPVRIRRFDGIESHLQTAAAEV